MSNFGLILNAADLSEKIKVFNKYQDLISSSVYVQNQTKVAHIVFSKSYPRNLMVAFQLSHYHFYFQHYQFRALFPRLSAYEAEVQTNTTDSIFGTP